VILAIDQGTSGTTCLVVDAALIPRGRGYRRVATSYPQPGRVEQDPQELWASVVTAAEEALAAAGVRAADLAAIGIANQRETTVVWDRGTGRPVHPAIVWQDRRTAERCRSLPAELLRERTGLLPDPYFSATKLEWLLGRYEGELAFGTVDSWLVWKLTGGAAHVTDASNASRTLLVSLAAADWDDELLGLFAVPRSVLPAIVPSSGIVAEAELLGARVPIAGIAGDQQAALFGQACLEPGRAKVTFGTGAFVLANAGADRLAEPPPRGVVRTVAWRLDGAPAVYALEGSVFAAGAAIDWLRDGLGLLVDAAESEAMAEQVPSSEGVFFVPALTGLGSPYWAPDARGLIAGLTRGTRREHLVRAALEAVALQTCDVLEAMGLDLDTIRADGGAAANRFLIQLLADLTRVPVEVSAERETTALGAAALAGLGAGLLPDEDAVAAAWRSTGRFEPRPGRVEVERLRAGWRDAVRRALV
jgi:glycerol kinase